MFILKIENGMSLVEVIIASAISITIAVAFMHLTENQSKSLRNYEARFDILDNQNSIKKILGDSENCLESFKNLNPSTNPNLSDLMKKNIVSGTFDPKFPIDQFFGQARIKITNYNLAANPSDPNEMILNVDYYFQGGTMEELTRKINLYVLPNNTSIITSCGYAGSDVPIIVKGPVVELHHNHGAPGNDFRATRVTSSCPSGFRALNCLVCPNAGCTPSYTTYNSNSATMHNGDRYNFQIAVEIEATGDTCALTFNAQFPESNDQYLRWADHRMNLQPVCTNI